MLAEILISLLLVIAGVFGLIGSVGLLKLRQPMQRLHAPTKATTVGVGMALVASAIYFVVLKHEVALQEFLIVIFLFITSPITAHFLSKANLHRSIRPEELPPTGTGEPWATLDVPPPGSDRAAG